MNTDTLRTNRTDSLIGRRLSKGYIVQKELGRGGMGVVYLGYAEGLQREVAIKVIRQRNGRFYERLRDRFAQEAQVVARLQHPNIVVVHDLGVEEDGLLYMVMERLVGQPLHRLIHEEGSLAREEALRLMLSLLSAMEAAHRKGVIHRDIKPANVMVCQTDDGMEQLKVLDFGLARPVKATARDPFTTMPLAEYSPDQPAPMAGPATTDSAVVGTPQYMAPEQARRGQATPRSDVYAAGIVLLEMLTGAAPVTPLWRDPDRSPSAWPPEESLRTLDPALRRILRCACAIAPEERFASAAQMRQALAGLMATAPAAQTRVIVRRSRDESEVFGARYRVINALRSGGMGELFRIEDLLTDQILLLKRVHSAVSARSSTHRFTLQLALEREFRTLASMRHPNIIDVLDYGFDAQGRAYFTMPLHERSRDLVSAGRGRSAQVKLSYLEQLLRALDYVHSRGVLHRDLKPANIIVTGDQVKVLDFGLASEINATTPQGGVSGTAAYTAPELLRGQPPSTRSDLFAVGLIAAELFLERYPYRFTHPTDLISQLIDGPPDSLAALPEAVRGVIAGLLSTDPRQRPDSARAALAALATATRTPLTLETVSTRESFLQAATLTGRAAEMEQLQAALEEALRDRGSLWLVSGESGVGKSRLLAELRAVALIRGASVVVCQAREGARPYHLWASLARWLRLTSQLSSSELRVLMEIAPDLAQREGSNSGPPSLDPDDARLRVFSVLASVLGRLSRPLMVVLEDLHLADAESLDLLAFLCADVEELPLLLAATTRTEGDPRLPERFPTARRLPLERLDPAALRALLAGVFHTDDIPDALITHLHTHTAGNPFFLVEVLREAAGQLGGLSGVLTQAALPESIEVPTVQRLLLSRVERAADIRAVLEQAAVLGRRLDPELLAAVGGWSPEDLTAALRQAADQALVEMHRSQWRFCHAQIREVLLADLSEERTMALHRRAAETLASMPAPDPAALARHWRGAQDAAQERRTALLAGQSALKKGASQTALAHLERVAELTEGADPLLDAQLGHALILTGQSAAGQARILSALAALDRKVPATDAGMKSGLLLEAIRQMLPGRTTSEAPEQLAALTHALNALLFDTYANDAPSHVQFYLALRTLNLPAIPENSAPLLRITAGVAFALRAEGKARMAGHYETRAARLLPKVTSKRTHGELGVMRVYDQLHLGRWAAAREAAASTRRIFEETGFKRGARDVAMGEAFAHYYQGQLHEALRIMEGAHASALRSGDPIHTFYTASGLFNYGRLLGSKALPEPPATLDGVLWFARAAWDTIQASVLDQRGERQDALALARSAAETFLSRTESLAYIKECQHLLAEVLLWSVEEQPDHPERAALLKTVKGLLKSREGSLKGMPVFTAGVLRHRAMLAHLSGKTRPVAVQLQAALVESQRLSLRLEEAHTRFAIARLGAADPAESARHVAEATAILEQTGAKPALARLRRWRVEG